jgi:hypothetical protein
VTDPVPPNTDGAITATWWSSMPYGLITCFTTKPGHQDAVVDSPRQVENSRQL